MGKNKRKEFEATKIVEIADPAKQELLIAENIPSAFAAEQTWPTKEEVKSSKIKMQTITENAKEQQNMDIEEEKSESSDEEENEDQMEEQKEELNKMPSEGDKSDDDKEESEKDAEEAKISAK